MLIVCGPSCARKSTFGRVAEGFGLSIVEGSVGVRELFLENRLPAEDILAFCRRWYSERGREAFAVMHHEQMIARGLNLDATVFLGCRAAEEVQYLEQLGRASRVIGLYADASVRFRRGKMRNRSDHPATLAEFVRHDMRELDLGLARLLSNYVDALIINGDDLLRDFEEVAAKEIEQHLKDVIASTCRESC